MVKRYYDLKTYNKIGSPDLNSIMFVIKNGKKVYGKVALIHFTGEKSKHKGKIQIGVIPFKKTKYFYASKEKGGANE